LAHRCKHLTSIESDSIWYSAVSEKLRASPIADRVSYLQIEADEFGDDVHGYVAACPSTVDFAVVDGKLRARCALAAAEAIRMGGFVVLDNANWFIRTGSRSPSEAQHRDRDVALWEEFESRVGEWRRLWTSNGVVDTAIWIRS
jgi:predicted O-methyltransferase YrrM